MNKCKLDDIKNKLFLYKAGSISYGLNTPTSDEDIRGIFVGAGKYKTPFHTIKEIVAEDHEDCKLLELETFLMQLSNMVPNALEMLWCDEADIIYSSPAYEYLRSNRSKFLTKRAINKYMGYARSQLKQLENHKKLLDNPLPEQPPQHHEFLTLIESYQPDPILKRLFKQSALNVIYEYDYLVSYGNNIFGVTSGFPSKIANAITKDGDFNISVKQHKETGYTGAPDFLVKYNEKEYSRAKQKHKDYWSWVEDRNQARSKLEQQHGYDTKSGMHAVRCLLTAQDIAGRGEVRVKSPYRDLMYDIRNGHYDYEQFREIVNSLTTTVETEADFSNLPVDLPKDLIETTYLTLRAIGV